MTETLKMAVKFVLLTCIYMQQVSIAHGQPALQYQGTITTEGRLYVLKGSKVDSLLNNCVKVDTNQSDTKKDFVYLQTEKSVAYLKGDMLRIETKDASGGTTMIRDNVSQTVAILNDRTKRAVYATETMRAKAREQLELSKGFTIDSSDGVITTVELRQKTDTQVIAGFTCKKVVAFLHFSNGYTDSSVYWYSPALFFEHIIGTTGHTFIANTSRLPGNKVLDALDKLSGFGFIMASDCLITKGLRHQTWVTKLDLKKKIKDKMFKVPDDYEVKPMF
jgi:hypothetical protein